MKKEKSLSSFELIKTNAAAPASSGREYGFGVLKGLIGAVPYVGTLMNEMLFETRSRLKQARLEELLGEIAHDLKSVDEKCIDREFIQSEEFSDLVEEVLLRAARTRSRIKRQCLKNTVVKAVQGFRPPSFAVLFLNLIDEISEEELTIYRELILENERAAREKRDIEPIYYDRSEIMGLSPIVFRQVLQSLIRKGLIFDDSQHRISTLPFTFVKPTELGAAFMDWIDSPQGNSQ